MNGRIIAVLCLGLLLGNLVAEFIKHYFHLFGN